MLGEWVDFRYEVDGKTYEYSMPGGGFVSLGRLIDILGIASQSRNAAQASENTPTPEVTMPSLEAAGEELEISLEEEVYKAEDLFLEAAFAGADSTAISENAKHFLEDVRSVEFSNQELVWVEKIVKDTTVGELKEASNLQVRYSAEMTEEKIAEIDAQTVEAGDWALLSVQAFTSEETLTVTMKDGERFEVKVTDAQNEDASMPGDKGKSGATVIIPVRNTLGATPVRKSSLIDESVIEQIIEAGSGTNEVSDSQDSTGLTKPEGSKTLLPNTDENNAEDGTYTLTLSVKAHSTLSEEEEVTKSNILFVMDRSSSMITHFVSNEVQEWYYGTRETAFFRGDVNPGAGYAFYGEINGVKVPLKAYKSVQGWYNGFYYSYPTEIETPINWNDANSKDFYFKYSSRSNNNYDTVYPDTGKLYVRSKTTRMYAEQVALNNLFSQLMAKNDASGENSDIVEISVISFGDERFDDKTSWKTETEANGWTSGNDYSSLTTVVNSNRYSSGTNWEEALQYAYDVINTKKTVDVNAGKTDEDYYVVFLTDGEPTCVEGESGGAMHTTDPETGDITGGYGNIYAYNEAKDEAKKLVDEGYKFYNIFTYRKDEDEKYSIYLTNYAYGNGNDNEAITEEVEKYFSDAQTPDDVVNALNNIFYTIEKATGHANVSITDTLTTDAMTTTVVHGKTNGYTYSVKDKNGTVLYRVTATGDLNNPNVVFEVPANSDTEYTVEKNVIGGRTVYSIATEDGTEYKMALADVDNETGELIWDLSGLGILMDGCTYSVSFVVWPDQDAYDYVAALNNGLETITVSSGDTVDVDWKDENAVDTGKGYKKGGSTQFPSIVKYPDGTFAVLTNTDQKLHYSVAEVTSDGTNTEVNVQGPYYQDLQTPNPMPLKATMSKLSKEWNVDRNPEELLRLLFEFEDGKPKMVEGKPVPKKYYNDEEVLVSNGFSINFKILQDT
ncbi:MAG: VWA domain-containing protein [Lachnospiraceae bacterium]|nr:VWA domain-containing protein [Lachnospiraceae bacterium]